MLGTNIGKTQKKSGVSLGEGAWGTSLLNASGYPTPVRKENNGLVCDASFVV
jgi:hypothetical protein